MNEQTQSAYGSLSSQIILDDFFDLIASKDVTTLLNRALQVLRRNLQATAGSIFFFTPAQFIKSGDCPQAVWNHIDHLETTVMERLHGGIWRVIEKDLPPVSIHKFGHENLTVMNTPLLQTTKVVGSLSVVFLESRRPSLAQRATLTQLARGIGQLAVTVAEHALTEKRYRELDLIYKMGQAMVSTLNIHQLLDDVMRLSANVLGAAASSIMLVDEENQELIFAATHSPQSNMLRMQRIPLTEGIAGWVATHGRPTVVNEIASDKRFNRQVDVRTGFLTQSIAAVPLKIKGATIGVLEVLNKDSMHGFDDDDLRLMTSIASQAAIALENAKLYQNLRDERDRILQAQANVRQALSRNLHDGAIQQISAISMSLEFLKQLLEKKKIETAYEELQSIQALVHKATKEARLVLFEIRPLILETQGLFPALDRYVAELKQIEDFNIELELPEKAPRYTKNVSGTIFSIIQEAINNAKKHAQANNLRITVQYLKDDVVFEVKDDGRGFDVSHIQSHYVSRTSLGLIHMKERAELIEGVLTFDSKTDGADSGTTVTLAVPTKSSTKPLKNLILRKQMNYES